MGIRISQLIRERNRYFKVISQKMSLDDATKRLQSTKQSLDDAYSPPANFLEIEVTSPRTHGVGNKRFADYEVRMRTNLPAFKVKEFRCRRRYSDFVWLRTEIKRAVQIYVPQLPEKAFLKQVPLLNQDDGIFEEDFIEDRRRGLEDFINVLAGHPLVQGEKCLHMFLQEDRIDRDGYFPGKQRQ